MHVLLLILLRGYLEALGLMLEGNIRTMMMTLRTVPRSIRVPFVESDFHGRPVSGYALLKIDLYEGAYHWHFFSGPRCSTH